MTRTKRLRIIEFLIIGLAMGILEDVLAISLATGASIDFRIFWIVLLVALPFAFVSEVVVDHPRFWEKIFPERKI